MVSIDIYNLMEKNNVSILPVDSEHSAIFQSLQGAPEGSLRKILLTASGGPFFGKTVDQLRDIRAEQALAHPTWKMGAKITIDSATLMNKGLEVIDLGSDVAPETFVKTAIEQDCQIICCSALLTTTMGVMADVVKAAEEAGIREGRGHRHLKARTP